MSGFLNYLELDQGWAIIRIGLGLWWLKSVLHKPYPKFVQGQMIDWTLSLIEHHPFPGPFKPLAGILERGRGWFPYLIVVGEASVALGLIFGFLTPISLLVAIFMNINYLVLAGVRPKDISVNKAYQCEQGQNWNMIVPQVVLLLTGAWTTWSVDAMLGWFI